MKKNALASVVFLGISTAGNFLITRLSLEYLNSSTFGIWLTISSVIGWFGFFDVGLANGLRNRLTESLAANDSAKAKMYLSTTYAMLGLLIGGIYLLFCAAYHWIEWGSIFNAPPGLAHDVTILFFWGFTFFSMRFILGITDVIYAALQRPAYANLFTAISSILTVLLVLYLRSVSSGSLLMLGFGFTCISMLIVPLASTIYLYGFIGAGLFPSIRSVDFSHAPDFLGLGWRFFVLRITFVVLFTSDNMIIAQVLGPEHVTTYNIAYKYFSVILLLYSTLTYPLWAAFTDAYTRGDTVWITGTVQKMERLWMAFAGLTLLMLACSGIAYRLWVGTLIHVPFYLSSIMAVFVILYTWNSVYNLFVNGAGRIQLQMILSVFAAVVNIPLSILFAKTLHMGNAGVMVATVTCLVPALIATPIQYRKILGGTAIGVWNA